jgi:hypothetical protein
VRVRRRERFVVPGIAHDGRGSRLVPRGAIVHWRAGEELRRSEPRVRSPPSVIFSERERPMPCVI